MKTIRVHQFGGLEALTYDEVQVPEPGEGEARVKVEAIGVNFLDVYQRMGRYQGSLPFALGQEAAGIVDAIGAGVKDLKVGDHVVYTGVQGSYAEQVIIPEWRLVTTPNKVDSNHAVAVMLQGITAHYLTHSTYPLKKCDTALVHAAGGGTGQLLVQIAKLCGVHVIGTVSTDEKAALTREAGADV